MTSTEAPPAASPYGIVLVIGGAGVAGECVVHTLLARGATVAVPSRSADRLSGLAAAVPLEHRARLHAITGDIGSEAGAAEVRAELLERVGPPRAAVASLGGWWEGEELVDLPVGIWERILHDNLTSHFLAARTFAPLLDQDRAPVYVTLAGIAAEVPHPAAAPISIAGTGQRMMIRTLAAAGIGERVRFHEITIMTPIVTRHWTEESPDPAWLRGDEVGGYVADVISPDFPGGHDLILELPAPITTS